jgi:hypothetical protein
MTQEHKLKMTFSRDLSSLTYISHIAFIKEG